jgi:hypothetical protein
MRCRGEFLSRIADQVQPYEYRVINFVTFVFYSLLNLWCTKSIICTADWCVGHARSYPSGSAGFWIRAALARPVFFLEASLGLILSPFGITDRSSG